MTGAGPFLALEKVGERIEFLSLAAAQLAAVRDLGQLAETLQQIICQAITIEHSAIYFIDPQTSTLRLYDTVGFDEEDRREAERTALARHPGLVLRSGQRLHVPDVLTDTQHQTVDSVRKFSVRSRLFLPVKSEGENVGTIGLSSPQPNHFSELHVAVLEFACHVAGVMYKNVRDSQEVLRQLEQIRSQERELRRLASPVIEVWDGVLVLPLIGTMSTQRFELVAQSALSATVLKRAQTVIVDLTGVEAVDAVATVQLVRLSRAIELLGCRCVLSGISPAVSRSLVEAGELPTQFSTYATLRQALAAAIAPSRTAAVAGLREEAHPGPKREPARPRK